MSSQEIEEFNIVCLGTDHWVIVDVGTDRRTGHIRAAPVDVLSTPGGALMRCSVIDADRPIIIFGAN